MKYTLPRSIKSSLDNTLRFLERAVRTMQRNPAWVYPAILVLIAILTHPSWYTPGAVLFHADWVRWTDQAAAQSYYALGAWSGYFGLGAPRVQIGFSLLQGIWALLAHIGIGYESAVKISLMIPISILGFISPYIAMNKLFQNRAYAFLSALFYGTTSYFLLRQGSQLQIALIYGLAPLFFYLFQTALQTNRLRSWILFALAYSFGLSYEIRIMYIISMIFVIYFIFYYLRKINVRMIWNALAAFLVILGTSSFWLLPTMKGGTTAAISELTSRDLFGSNLFDLAHALALSVSSWTGGKPNESFQMQAVPILMWLIPIVVLLPLLLSHHAKKEEIKLASFFFVVALLGLFLTKQETPPIAQAYTWLYGNVPGFSLFREASKFYILTAFGYMGLLGLAFVVLARINKKLLVGASLAVVIVASANLFPLVNGSYNSLLKAKTIPADYAALNSVLGKDPDPFFRILWVPNESQWGYFDAAHPRTSLVSMLQSNWKTLKPAGGSQNSQQQMLNIFDNPYANDVLSGNSIKYVVVPSRDTVSDDNFYKYYGNNRQLYIDKLDSLNWLQKVNSGSGDVVVYENINYKPLVYPTGDIVGFNSLADLRDKHDVASSVLKSNDGFTLNTSGNDTNTDSVRDLYDGIKPGSIRSGKVLVDPGNTNDEVLYENTNFSLLRYNIEGVKLNLLSDNTGTLADGQASLARQTTDPKVLASLRLRNNTEYYLESARGILLLDTNKSGIHRLGSAGTKVGILEVQSNNLIANNSFESAPWNTKAADCDPYDKTPNVHSRLTTDESSEGHEALLLTSLRHDACNATGSIGVISLAKYVASFDYKAINADRVGYSYTFNDRRHTTVKKFIDVSDNSWHSLNVLITPPADATGVNISLIGTPDVTILKPSQTYFDNVKLQFARDAYDSQATLLPKYEISNQNSSQELAYLSSSATGKNLVSNPSFEKGLWQKKVGDCNAYDDKPKILMHLSSDANDGKKSLELSAKSHAACTSSPTISVDGGSKYLFGFDAKSANTKLSSYALQFNDPNNTTIRRDVATSDKWSKTSHLVSVPAGATQATVIFYSYAGKNINIATKNTFDDIIFIQIPDFQNRYFAITARPATNDKLPSVTYSSKDPTYKQVTIKGAKSPFFLNVGEAYSTNWVAGPVMNGGLRLPGLSGSHPSSKSISKVNSPINMSHNAWFIDPGQYCQEQPGACTKNANGTHDMKLSVEYSPQRWYFAGIIVSLSTLLGCAAYGVTLLITRRRSHTKDSKGLYYRL